MDRTKVSFAEAEGRVEYPDFLRWGEIDKRLRSRLSNTIYNYVYDDRTAYSAITRMADLEFIIDYYLENSKFMYKSEIQKLFINNSRLDYLLEIIKKANYIDIFDILQFYIRHIVIGDNIILNISEALDQPYSHIVLI
ncbi:MAG: hypothetical protein ACRCWF_16375 [Beijerinckiaceae bacterium]